jgi:small-conductance mechanosensitive channel
VTLRAREVGWAQALAWLLRFLGVAFAVALAAAVSGYMPLARTAAFVPLSMIYGATAFYAVTRAIFAVTALLLRVQPLVRLRTMQAQRDMVERRTRRVVGWIAVASWLYMIRANLTSIGVPGDALQRIADVDLVLGSLRLTVGDVVAFGVTVWASFLLSRFVRFVLGEEVFPRMQMAHGLPYALSSLIHYAILLVGFFVALASLGFDSSRMAVLVGALGVGVGFGLQAIVNNFVSGLILLFERPIQIGDTVQIGDVTGDVKRIGIRSSTVRTWAGAEVIVPNSSLISERVTNWTLSDRSRRFELQLGVAYGTSPAEMLVLLTEVARKHTEILAYPEPIALFLGFGDSALNFELRAWVHDGNRVAIVKSEITVALLDALAAAGVSVPFPQREVHVIADGDAKAPATPRG